MPYVTESKNLSSEPEANWKSVQYYLQSIPSRLSSTDEDDGSSLRSSTISNTRSSFLVSSVRASMEKAGFGEMLTLVKHSERPTNMHALHDIEINEVRLLPTTQIVPVVLISLQCLVTVQRTV